MTTADRNVLMVVDPARQPARVIACTYTTDEDAMVAIAARMLCGLKASPVGVYRLLHAWVLRQQERG